MISWKAVRTAKKINHYYADGACWSAEIWSPGNLKRTGKQKLRTPTCPAWNWAVFDTSSNIVSAGHLLRTFQQASRSVVSVVEMLELQ